MRGLEAYWIGSYILICGFVIVWVPIGLLSAFAVASIVCITVLYRMLRRAAAAKAEPSPPKFVNPVFRRTRAVLVT